VRQQIASALNIVVQVSRMSDGSRKIMSISEVTGMEENIISMQDIFVFQKRGISPTGKVVGTFRPTRIRPRFIDKLMVAGISLPQSVFENTLEVN
jgi:pilus assembly protein CpaF